jgi:hypothetical protein
MNKQRKCTFNVLSLAAKGKGIIWILLLLVPLWGQAHDVEVIKTIQKAYPLDGDELINLSNKYGKIHVNTWNKKQVSIEVTITAYGANEKIANQRLDEVEIDFDRGSDEIEIITLHKSDMDVKTSKKGVHVTYRLNLPPENPLQIQSKFCDIYVGDRLGNVNIKHANGKIVMGNLNGKKNWLQLAFAQTDLAYLASGNLTLSYGRLVLSKANDLSLKADGTHVEIGEADELYIQTNLSNFNVNEVRDIKGTFNSADFRVEHLGGTLDMETKYARSFKVVHVGDNFRGVRVRSLYSPIHLLFADEASFTFNAKVQFGELKYDSENVSMTIIEDEDNKLTQYLARFGSRSKSQSQVEVESQYGHIRIE